MLSFPTVQTTLLFDARESMTESIRQCLLTQVRQRGIHKTICPSEVARALGGEQWRDLMEPVRTVGRELVAEGKIVVARSGGGPGRCKRAYSLSLDWSLRGQGIGAQGCAPLQASE